MIGHVLLFTSALDAPSDEPSNTPRDEEQQSDANHNQKMRLPIVRPL